MRNQEAENRRVYPKPIALSLNQEMMEDTNKGTSDPNTKQEEKDDVNAGDSKEVITREDLDKALAKAKSDYEKGVQKIHKELKEKDSTAIFWQDVVKESKKVANDPKYLVDLYYRDQKKAETILEEYYDGMTFDQYVKEADVEDDTPSKIEAMAKKQADDILQKRAIETKIESFIEKMGYDEEIKKRFQEELADDMDGKPNITMEKLDKYLLKTHNFLTVDIEEAKNSRKQEETAKKIAVSEGNSGGKTDNKTSERAKELMEFRKKYS